MSAAKETPWEPVKIDGHWYKPYVAEASSERKGSTRFVEGISGYVPYEEEPLESIIARVKDGISSAMSYTNSLTLEEFRNNARFFITHPNSTETQTRLS